MNKTYRISYIELDYDNTPRLGCSDVREVASKEAAVFDFMVAMAIGGHFIQLHSVLEVTPDSWTSHTVVGG